MNNRGIPVLPPRWLSCPRMGDMILDIFVPFKTPLNSKFDHVIPSENTFHVDDVFRTAEPYKLGLIVDLTKSKRFYNRHEVTDANCKYLKIECKGNEETPTPDQVNLFIGVVNQFLDGNPGDQKVGIHCTHGFNRTGFLIVAYLVEELNYGVEIAVQIFADARPPGIYKQDYLTDLFERYGTKEDCPCAPPLPAWCLDGDHEVPQLKRQHSLTSSGEEVDNKYSCFDQPATVSNAAYDFPPPPRGTPCLMSGVHRVATLDQDDREAHEARDLADRLLKIGGSIYTGPGHQLIPADGQSSDSETNEPGDIENDPLNPDTSVDEPAESTTKSYRHKQNALRFKGSQPVSISQRNVDALINCDYCVTYKADGVRYVLLISGPGKVYLIDRANFVYKPDTLHFPGVPWVKCVSEQSGTRPLQPMDFARQPNSHLTNTLLDGEMVMCRDSAKTKTCDGGERQNFGSDPDAGSAPRFLIYDIVTLNGRPVGRFPFFDRFSLIDKEIIWPRNTAGHLGLVDFSVQSFSVRRKTFRPLNQTEELLKPEFFRKLDHETDGLILQPCGPDEFYVLGTCPQQLKWKPPHLNTIDFRCKITYESKVGEIPGYVGHLYLGGLTVPSARLSHVGPKDKCLDGKIVECTIDPVGGGWKVLRVRTDKTEPNYHKSGVAIIESILSPVTTQQLLSCVRQRGLKLQARLQAAPPGSSSSSAVTRSGGPAK